MFISVCAISACPCFCLCPCVCICAFMWLYVRLCVLVFIFVYLYVFVFPRVCLCVFERDTAFCLFVCICAFFCKYICPLCLLYCVSARFGMVTVWLCGHALKQKVGKSAQTEGGPLERAKPPRGRGPRGPPLRGHITPKTNPLQIGASKNKLRSFKQKNPTQ